MGGPMSVNDDSALIPPVLEPDPPAVAEGVPSSGTAWVASSRPRPSAAG